MRKMWKKSMAVLTAAALTMASLSGCQSADKEETAAEAVTEADKSKEET